MKTVAIPREITSAVSNEEAKVLAKLAANGVVLELGSYCGFSTVVMAQTAKIVHAVDWHQGDQHIGNSDTLAEFRENLRWNGLAEKVVIHIGRFEDVLPVFRDHSFDLIFLDGAHDEASVRRDIALVQRLARRSAYLAFHDYGRDPQEHEGFGVDGPVNELARKIGKRVATYDWLAVLE